jgi:hypothetical protein
LLEAWINVYINSHLLNFISYSEMHPFFRELSISYLLVCVQGMPRTHLKHYCYEALFSITFACAEYSY